MTSPYLSPGKYYSFALIQPREIRWELLRETGVIEAYGVIVSDILTLLFSYLSLRNYLARKYKSKRARLHPQLKYAVVITLLLWLTYMCLLLFSSSQVAAFPTFSLVTALQFCKMILIFCSAFLWLIQDKKVLTVFYQSLLALVVGVISIASLQIFGSANESVVQNSVAATLEESKLVHRPNSIFLFSNELAFLLQLFIFLLLLLKPYIQVAQSLKNIFKLSIFFAIFIILFTQSRTVWLSGGITLIFSTFLFAEQLRNFAQSIWSYRYFCIATIVFVLVFIIFPRIYYTQFSLQDGSATIRGKMIEEGLAALQEAPFTGFGANSNVITMLRYFPKGYIQDFPFPVHVGYLQIALEAGVFGSVCFFVPWLLPLRLMFNLKKWKNYLSKQHVLWISSIVLSILIYYIFQPHAGRVEFFYLGLVMATCLTVTQYSIEKQKPNEKT